MPLSHAPYNFSRGWPASHRAASTSAVREGGQDARKATTELQDLVARELLQQIGTRRWARYSLAQQLNPEATHRTHRHTPADRREEILQALGTTTASRAELAHRTGLSDQTVRRWLTILRHEGLVEATEKSTASKNTKYRRTATPDTTEKDDGSSAPG